MKVRWLVAAAAYAAACVVALFVPWPETFDSGDEIRSDGALLWDWIAGGSVLMAIRLCWMILLLIATATVWFSARREVRPAHTELSLALALGAIAYPFVSSAESRGLCTWVQSSAAAFVIVFAAVLGWKAFALERKELRMGETRIRIS